MVKNLKMQLGKERKSSSIYVFKSNYEHAKENNEIFIATIVIAKF